MWAGTSDPERPGWWDAASPRSVLSDLGLIVVGVPVSGSVRFTDGSTREMPLAELTATQVLSAVPWRAVRSHRGQHHLPGLYWSATTGGHVVYESRLELARLLLADFDPDVVRIVAQPLLVREADRRHVPDFLLRRADGSVLIVNVNPRPTAWTTRKLRMPWRGRGGCSPSVVGRCGAARTRSCWRTCGSWPGYQRAALLELPPGVEGILRTYSVVTIAGAQAALRDAGVAEPRAVVLHLLWRRGLRADLERPLTAETELEVLL